MKHCFPIEARWGRQTRLLVVVWVEEMIWLGS